MCKFNENEKYPMFGIEPNGLYHAIDPNKLSNILGPIEDRMNRKEGEKEKMTTNTTNIAGSFTYTGHAPMDTKVRDSFEKTYAEYGKAFKALQRYSSCQYPIPQIKNVIFNYPATIVFWNDDTKTVVKCDERDQFDPEKGITMAFFKKMHGNIGHYFEEIKKWTSKFDDQFEERYKEILHSMFDKIDNSAKKTPDNPRWHIWYKIGMLDEIHCYEKDYSTKYSAVRRAKKLANHSNITIWAVSQKAPFGPESDDVEWHLA